MGAATGRAEGLQQDFAADRMVGHANRDRFQPGGRQHAIPGSPARARQHQRQRPRARRLSASRSASASKTAESSAAAIRRHGRSAG